MPVVTKQIWTNTDSYANTEWKATKDDYLNAKKLSGDLIGSVLNVNELTCMRTWKDDAAADDWLSFITAHAATGGYTVTATKV
jgi:hypothetical protein